MSLFSDLEEGECSSPGNNSPQNHAVGTTFGKVTPGEEIGSKQQDGEVRLSFRDCQEMSAAAKSAPLPPGSMADLKDNSSLSSADKVEESPATPGSGVLAKARMDPWSSDEDSNDENDNKAKKKRRKKTKIDKFSKLRKHSVPAGQCQLNYIDGSGLETQDLVEEDVDLAIVGITSAAKAMTGAALKMRDKPVPEDIIVLSSGGEENYASVKKEKVSADENESETRDEKFKRTKEAVQKGYENVLEKMKRTLPTELPQNSDPTKKKKTQAIKKRKNPVKPNSDQASLSFQEVSISNAEKETIEQEEQGEIATGQQVESFSVAEEDKTFSGTVKQRVSQVLAGSGTLLTNLGQPRGAPSLLVKFTNLGEDAEHLAEALCGFDQDKGDLIGDMKRESDGVKVGIYINIAHCEERKDVYQLRNMLRGIEGTFCGSTISLEIKYVLHFDV